MALADSDQQNVDAIVKAASKMSRSDFMKLLAALGGASILGSLVSYELRPPTIAPTITPTLGYDSAIMPASYVIFLDGSTCNAVNGRTGAIDYSGTDAGVIINDALNALPHGGTVHLAGNTTFTLGSTPITINQGSSASYGTWILEGEGDSTIIQQYTANTDAIDISGQTFMILRDFRINLRPRAGRAIFGDCTGANHASFINSRIENIDIIDDYTGDTPSSTHDAIIYLINPFYSKLSRIYVYGAPTTALMRIENGSGSWGGRITKFFGNCDFDQIWLDVANGVTGVVHCLQMIATSGSSIMNLNHFSSLYTLCATSSGHSVHLDGGSAFNTFCFVDLEGGNGSIYLDGTSGNGAKVQGNRFLGGYANAGPYHIYTTTNTTNNCFKHLTLDSGPAIYDAGNYNVFEDIHGYNTGSYTFAGGNYIGRGTAAANQYFSNSGSQDIVDGGTITHHLVATPRTVQVNGSVAGQIVTVTSVDPTHITVAIKTAAGGAGSYQTVYWSAAI